MLDLTGWCNLGLQSTRAAPLLDPHPLPPFNSGYRAPKDVDKVCGEARAGPLHRGFARLNREARQEPL
eukprot:548987-Lingulodinium_polyedra.AAC.1